MKQFLLAGALVLLPASAWANCNATSAAPALQPGTQPCSMDLSGNLRVLAAQGAGGANGSVTAAGTNGTVAQAVQGITNGTPVPVLLTAGTASAAFFNIKANTNTGSTLTSAPLISAATTNATSVKASTASFYGGYFANTTATAVWIKIYNKNSAPVPGTDTPVMVIELPGTSSLSIQVPAVGVALTAGFGFAITANPALNDATAIAAGAAVGQFFYN